MEFRKLYSLCPFNTFGYAPDKPYTERNYTASNKPTETPSAKVTIFRSTNTQLPQSPKPFCNFQGVIL